MNYLTRLAAQTGLVSELPGVAPKPVGIKEIEVTVSPPLPLDSADVGQSDQASVEIAEPDTIAEAAKPLAVEPPKAPSEPHKPAPDPISTSLELDAPTQDAPQADTEISDPEASREILLRHVMQWVSSNEPTLSQSLDEPAPGPATDQPEARPNNADIHPPVPVKTVSPDAGGEIPSLAINSPDDISATAPAPETEDRVSRAVRDAEPVRVAAAPRPVHQPTPISQPSIVEEKIEISIGTIHLDVTPPPPGRVPHVPVQSAPVSVPAPVRPSSSSRLARRFIRV